MKLNSSKTKIIIVSTSCTMHPQSQALTIGGTVMAKTDDIDIFGVIFNSTMTFEKHLRLILRAVCQRLAILRRPCRCFQVIVLTVLESVQHCGGRLPIHTFN